MSHYQTLRSCVECRGDMPFIRWSKKYCSSSCKQAAYRRRRFIKLMKPPRRTAP